MKFQALLAASALFASAIGQATSAASPPGAVTVEPDQLRQKIQSLRAADHYWHKIVWKKSITEGLIESKRSHKPLFVWAFIDYPDQERC